jgi:hypothetical protein
VKALLAKVIYYKFNYFSAFFFFFWIQSMWIPVFQIAQFFSNIPSLSVIPYYASMMFDW